MILKISCVWEVQMVKTSYMFSLEKSTPTKWVHIYCAQIIYIVSY